MKILVISFEDDNFGDNLIRICFEKILEVVLRNLSIKDYEIERMALKKIKEESIKNSDIIFFAGGGLLGLSYLNFFEYLEKIIAIAENKDIPVVFSSVGVNNMDAADDDYRLKALLSSKCIKAISVRENIAFFEKYIGSNNIPLYQVCDPAVWTRFVFNEEVQESQKNKETDVIGINVVRGGLFKDNKRNWKLADEIKYLLGLKSILEEKGVDYRFYTNGSFLDNNALRYFAKINDIPDEKIVYVHSTKDLVKTIASFSSVYAIRMHSSIIAYSLEKPCVNLVWNDKVGLFYKYIGRGNQAIEVDDWKADRLYEIMSVIRTKNNNYDKNYLMSLYDFLYEIINSMFKLHIAEKYSFEKIVSNINNDKVSIFEEINDYRVKIEKGENQYLYRFIDLKEADKELKLQKKRMEQKEKELQKKSIELEKKINALKQKEENLKLQKEEIKSLKKEVKNKDKTIEKKQQQLDKLNNLFVIRAGRKVKGILRSCIGD